MKAAINFFSGFFSSEKELAMSDIYYVVDWPEILPNKNDEFDTNILDEYRSENIGLLENEFDCGNSEAIIDLSWVLHSISWNKINNIIMPVFNIEGK